MDDKTKEAAKDTAKGAAAGAAAGAGFWAGIPLVANFIGFGSGGIAAGSTAASMMSAAAAANGGGVAAGSFVATMQSIGATGLATPIGLGLVVAGAVTAAAGTLVYKTFKSNGSSEEALAPADSWIVIVMGLGIAVENAAPEATTALPEPQISLFDSEEAARKAYDAANASSKALFAPGKQLVLTQGWQERFREIVKAL